MVSNWLSRANSFWGWFIKKSPAFIVLTSITVVSIFGLGVGGTIAATGVIPNPFTDEKAEVSGNTQREEFQNSDFDPEAGPGLEFFYHKDGQPLQEQGAWLAESSWMLISGTNNLQYRFSNSHMHMRFIGQCPTEVFEVSMSPQNYGYLSAPVAGIQGLGGGSSGRVEALNSKNCNQELARMWVQQYKCYNLNEVWIDVTAPSSQAGQYRIPVPASIATKDCPPGAENNDSSKFMFEQMYERLKDYPQAVVTPPRLHGGPATIEWGPYVPSAPSPTPTPETSPAPTTEPSPTPSAETSPAPTTEPSPTPSSP